MSRVIVTGYQQQDKKRTGDPFFVVYLTRFKADYCAASVFIVYVNMKPEIGYFESPASCLSKIFSGFIKQTNLEDVMYN